MKFHMFTEAEAEDVTNAVQLIASENTILIREKGFSPIVCMNQIDENTLYGNYTVGCLRTWNQKHSLNMQVSNLCHGITGELAEVLELQPNENGYKEKVLDELGDLFYYRQLLRWNFADDLTPTQIVHKDLSLSDFFKAVSLINDVGKKVAFHKKFSADITQERYVLGTMLVDRAINTILSESKLTPEEVIEYNLDKLAKRHGTSFNPDYTK